MVDEPNDKDETKAADPVEAESGTSAQGDGDPAPAEETKPE
jgi:hypothetical protein